VSLGISRSTIDLNDAKQMLMPRLTEETVAKLAELHRSFSAAEADIVDRTDWQRRLDESVAAVLRIPSTMMLIAREFCEYRLPLVKGKAPQLLSKKPDEKQLLAYARRLKEELDTFLERRSRRHRVVVLSSSIGIVVSIELAENGSKADVRNATQHEVNDVRTILDMAEQQFSQWVYIRRSVRVFAGSRIHICKPARRLEWTETQAILDAADVVAEVAEVRSRAAA
jgi:hypothetical protein